MTVADVEDELETGVWDERLDDLELSESVHGNDRKGVYSAIEDRR